MPPRKKTKKYSPKLDVSSDRQIEDVDTGLSRVQESQNPAAMMRNISSVLNKMSGYITAEDLGRASVAALAKTAAATVMSQSVPANSQAMQDAHQAIMQNRGGSQPPHRYGRKPPQKPATE